MTSEKHTIIKRCAWVPVNDELYKTYHDTEWGVPVFEDKKIFEFLVLESAQAGLAWITILRKRENYKKAFADFDPEAVSNFDDKKIEELMGNAGIIRNRAKITATISNARIFLEVQREYGSFSKYLWKFVGGKPTINEWTEVKSVPAKTETAQIIANDLKKRGFKFLGPTIVYAHMQATGMVNDHTVDCFRYNLGYNDK